MTRADHAREIRLGLKDPHRLCFALGLLTKKHTKAGGNYVVCCPSHNENTASCSVRVGPDGTIALKCFGCDLAGDALHLIAAVHQLDLSTNFKEILLIGADIAGLQTVIAEINGDKPVEKRDLPPPTDLPPERAYPPAGEVLELWTGASSVVSDGASNRLLVARALDPDTVERFDLARVIGSNQRLPRWASYQSGSWRASGHRMLVPVFDAAGEMRSVRAWRVDPGESPKRLPPAGCRATGLVMANPRAVRMLRQSCAPCRVLIVEGEPDMLTASVCWSWFPVFGIVSGSWGPDFAARIPYGSEIVVMTDHDPAGDKYAEQIKSTVKSRAQVIRSAA